MKEEAIGDQYSFIPTIKIATIIQEHGMMIKMVTANSLVSTCSSTLRIQESLLKELLKLIKREFTLTLK